MKIILDCNIWISFLIGHQTNSIQQILTDSALMSTPAMNCWKKYTKSVPVPKSSHELAMTNWTIFSASSMLFVEWQRLSSKRNPKFATRKTYIYSHWLKALRPITSFQAMPIYLICNSMDKPK